MEFQFDCEMGKTHIEVLSETTNAGHAAAAAVKTSGKGNPLSAGISAYNAACESRKAIENIFENAVHPIGDLPSAEVISVGYNLSTLIN